MANAFAGLLFGDVRFGVEVATVCALHNKVIRQPVVTWRNLATT